MKNRIELTLKFPAKGVKRLFSRYTKKKIGFRYTHWALFRAMDVLECSPSDLEKQPEDEQLMAISFGAAEWDRLKTGKRVFFSYEEMKAALERGSIQQGRRLGEAWANISMPDWMSEQVGEASPTKKKSPKKTS